MGVTYEVINAAVSCEPVDRGRRGAMDQGERVGGREVTRLLLMPPEHHIPKLVYVSASERATLRAAYPHDESSAAVSYLMRVLYQRNRHARARNRSIPTMTLSYVAVVPHRRVIELSERLEASDLALAFRVPPLLRLGITSRWILRVSLER